VGGPETGFAQNDAQNGIDGCVRPGRSSGNALSTGNFSAARASGPAHEPFDVGEILFVGHFRTAGEGGDRVVSEDVAHLPRSVGRGGEYAQASSVPQLSEKARRAIMSDGHQRRL